MPVRVWSSTPSTVAWACEPPASAAKSGSMQFQVADGDGVEHHGIGAVVVGGAVEVVERGALGVAEVVQDGAGGADGGGAVGEAAAIEREQLEVVAQGAVGVIAR